MIHGQNTRSAILIAGVSTTNAATASGFVDTQDYDFAFIDVCATTSNVVSNNATVLTLSEGTVTTGFTAIAAFTGDDTTDGFTIADADTSDPQVIARMNVKLDKRERYLRLQVSPLTTQIIWAHCILSRADETPDTATLQNVGVVVTG